MDTGVFDRVMVVTDHDEIASVIRKEGGEVFLSQKEHQSGSDRIAEAAESLEADVIVNVQGDEPFQDRKSLSDLVRVFMDDNVEVASLMSHIKDPALIHNPNIVKVVTDKEGFSLYFSRYPIPYVRDEGIGVRHYRHIGIYAYRKPLLMAFTQWEKSPLEKAEMLEQLRILENGHSIRMVETDHQAVAIDVPEDLEKAIRYYKERTSEKD
jgi:3-deoxy-manno-octulosonate cytidylyltransferase (CMP-KDO synthetase)